MKRLVFVLTFALMLCKICFSQDVIDPILQNVMNEKSEEMIRINIIFKSQINHNILKGVSDNIADKEVRRNRLVDELKLFSEEKQRDVMSILEAEKRNNNVSNIRSHWISNTISCNAKRDAIYLLSKHHDIELIGYDEMKYMACDGTDIIDDKSIYEESEITENVTMVKADKVWELGYTGKGVLVAIVDSGVNYNHVDLADHLWDGGASYPHHGYNVINDNDDTMDRYGHGTHCAGTICGDGSSGVYTGIAPDATLMCIKAIDDYGYATTSSFNAGMEFAIEHQADVISLSLGVMNASASDKTLMRNTCVNALQLGIVAAVAVGNDAYMMMAPIPNNVRTPGNCPPPWLHPDQEINAGELSCVVAVGAIDFNENIYENGSQGPVTWTDTQFGDYPYNPNIGLIRPDVCAPGVTVKSANYYDNTGHHLRSGTSMATPCVAGVMALMLEKEKTLTPAEICMTLETTAKKLSETKSNSTGTGLIDAYEAVINIRKGNLSFNGIAINDKEDNNDGNLNAGENVKMSLNFINNSNETYNNIKAVVSCSSEFVTFTDSEAIIENLAANEEITLLDEFALSLSDDAECKAPLLFDFKFYDNNTQVSAFSVMIYASESKLEYASIIIENDDNNNGVLEAGESADLGVVMNNIGNEIAVKVEATLSSESEFITINQNESDYNSIGGESSAVAYFKVTADGNLGDSYSIPFTLTTNDFYGNENTFNFSYANHCNYIFELNDYQGNGWNGAYLMINYANGNPSDSLTLLDGSHDTFSLTIENNVEVSLGWKSGQNDSGITFVVKRENGRILYSSPMFTSKDEVLFSWLSDCPCENEYYEMCDAVKDLSGEQVESGVVLSWEDNKEENLYEIYRGTRFLGTTNDNIFTDETIEEEGDFIYSVRRITDGCSGMFQNVSVHFVPTTIEENAAMRCHIYPNPSNEHFIIKCEEMTNITIFNIVGSKVLEERISGDTYIVNGLESGVYIIEIESKKGKSVSRILKLNQ